MLYWVSFCSKNEVSLPREFFWDWMSLNKQNWGKDLEIGQSDRQWWFDFVIQNNNALSNIKSNWIFLSEFIFFPWRKCVYLFGQFGKWKDLYIGNRTDNVQWIFCSKIILYSSNGKKHNTIVKRHGLGIKHQ